MQLPTFSAALAFAVFGAFAIPTPAFTNPAQLSPAQPSPAQTQAASPVATQAAPPQGGPAQPRAVGTAPPQATPPQAIGQAPVQAAPPPPCAAPRDLVYFDQPLLRTALALASGDPVVIVAIGSSSTWGAGATSPAQSYPSRLEADLRARFPANPIVVVNRGAGGEDALQMLARFDEAIKERPDLVIWQVGTNAVLRDHSLAGEAPLISEGIRRLKASHADVILMDPQYAPKVLAKSDAPAMVDLIGKAARDEKVNVFQRFAIMRNLVQKENAAFDSMLSPDGLHMNDWSYACVAKLLTNAIADAVRRPAVARAPRR
jgi:acyl-CoA thioesterase-1